MSTEPTDVTADRDLEAVVLSRCHTVIDSRGTFVNIENVLPLIREREAAAWERALREAADRWEQAVSQNTNPLDLEVADRVVGWLRDRADRAAANPYTGSEGE
jgi:hypothetical protein